MKSNWKEILVSPSDTIQNVMKVIDLGGFQLALVVNSDNNLLATVTDGDIRRALIDDKPLTALVSEIMHTSPRTVSRDASKSKILEILEKEGISAIPVVDNNVVVGIETLHQLLQRERKDNPVFLMAGGFGTRLKPLTDSCPKPLLKVGSKPILEIVLLNFIKSGFHRFFVSTHYLPEMIKSYFGNGEKWGITIEYIHETTPLGTGGALGLLPNNLSDLPIIVMNGDILTKINLEELLNFHNANNATATMCVREYEYQVPFGVIESKGKNIISMVEKPIQKFHVNAGTYVISQEVLESVNNNEVIDMPTLLERHLNNHVIMYPFHEYWLDIGRVADFERAQIDILTLGLD